VINLVPDKARVFREIHRVLKPGGRLVVSDVVLDGDLPDVISEDVAAYVGCVAGAVQRTKYIGMLEAAHLGDFEVLKDVDFIAAVGESIPEEIAEVMDTLGLTRNDVQGVVRSITYRAQKATDES
jgi:ubiquinone/menaquinone biosynthesis C-methylase UbiE